MAIATRLARPQRWDRPFDPDFSDEALERLKQDPVVAAIDTDSFPKSIPLDGILGNDSRILSFKEGEIVVREGDYGNSAFLVLSGKVKVVINPPLTGQQIGRQSARPASLSRAIASLWRTQKTPETRDVSRYGRLGGMSGTDKQAVFLQDFPAVLNGRDTADIGEGSLFGELAALGRTPRAATVICSEDAEMLEIRWQGLRELRRFDAGWKRQIDTNYRNNALQAHLQDTPLFEGLDATTLQAVADATLFETYGSFDWSSSFQRSGTADAFAQEPVIAREGEYPDGLLLIRAGFARVSVKQGAAERTLTYLSAGDDFGLSELHQSWKGDSVPVETTLRGIGYVDALRVPSRVLEEHVFPKLLKAPSSFLAFAARPLAEDSMQEWTIEERFVNGTMAMVIDMDRCVRCDDCVRACASTHGGNPRFVRHGKIHDHKMIANACMHCADPVCMIGCPTGAIHRSQAGGTVVINDDTCIGCGTCANSCPYENIRLVEIRDQSGLPIQDEMTGNPIKKATKCDLCEDMPGGPACARACPHGALQRVNL
ncbi:MAG: cyclic nucleotide-binding domain-containing protein [Alphaproteobacteria bacterium]